MQNIGVPGFQSYCTFESYIIRFPILTFLSQGEGRIKSQQCCNAEKSYWCRGQSSITFLGLKLGREETRTMLQVKMYLFVQKRDLLVKMDGFLIL